MAARRLSRRMFARMTWKRWLVLSFLGFIASGAIGLLFYIASSAEFNLGWQAWTTIAVTIGVFFA